MFVLRVYAAHTDAHATIARFMRGSAREVTRKYAICCMIKRAARRAYARQDVYVAAACLSAYTSPFTPGDAMMSRAGFDAFSSYAADVVIYYYLFDAR